MTDLQGTAIADEGKFNLNLGFPLIRRSPMEPITDRWKQVVSRIQIAIAFIRKAWEWVGILWGAQMAIEAFNHDGEEIVELWLTNHQSAFKPGKIPLIVSALMFLQPEILRDWLDNYEPGQFSHYTHPEALEEFEENYGSLIRRSKRSARTPKAVSPVRERHSTENAVTKLLSRKVAMRSVCDRLKK